MTDNQLFTLVRTAILAGLAARGYPNTWDVARKYQPVQQGANSTPTVYVFKIADKRHGSPQETDVWDADAQAMTRGESQQMETTFQVSVLMDESTDPNSLTPSDAANDVCAIMQAEEALVALRAVGVGVLRVGQVTNPYDGNDRNRFAANPSFDFVLTHRRAWQRSANYAVTIEGSINRV